MLVLGSENKNHGVIFDKFALMEHVMQFKKDPVSGDSLQFVGFDARTRLRE